jgi:hypothetical protein
MNDPIDRQAAIDAIDKIFPADPMRNDYTQGITCGAALATEYIKQLPSAQPNLPEWARKVEEYRKSVPDTIYNPLAWALYQVWKEYDR